MKQKRHSAILQLISDNSIETQDELIEKLRANGFQVTQATISRDIRDLRITKMMREDGKYCYTLQSGPDRHGTVKFNDAFVEAITGVDYASNIIVIKTYAGMAQAVATGIDSISMPEIVGCIAGDDTIMVVTRDDRYAKEISEKFKIIMKSV